MPLGLLVKRGTVPGEATVKAPPRLHSRSEWFTLVWEMSVGVGALKLRVSAVYGGLVRSRLSRQMDRLMSESGVVCSSQHANCVRT